MAGHPKIEAFEFTDHLFDLKRWHRSSNAEIKALAKKELNALPRVRIYEERSNPESNFRIDTYEAFRKASKVYEDYRMVFPYPYQQIGVVYQQEVGERS
jgi:hypothetical protein